MNHCILFSGNYLFQSKYKIIDEVYTLCKIRYKNSREAFVSFLYFPHKFELHFTLNSDYQICIDLLCYFTKLIHGICTNFYVTYFIRFAC